MRDTLINKTTSFVAHTLEELTADFYLFGTKVREQVKKFFITKNNQWGSIAFFFKESEQKKLMLASFKSDGNLYKRQSYFIIKNKEEAEKIINIIKESFDVEDS